ncbi:sporulation transcriptional regulator SpoIIID [Clostridium cochlearium]|uniref:sporulation transcriptional regulator SpoIIID n=1 Tax=Clostridium cochlearium TaxID=1494 RepID=UPI00185464DF|nr:sporulation transcriptional regulator SpoIIID [Clostridium cochlearium]NMA58537.1 stage III sporulation protein D [Clostridium cochlearium]
MKSKLIEKNKRILKEAQFMVDGKHTLRTTARHFNVSKSAVHLDVTKDLKKLNYPLYLEVQKVIAFNKSQRAKRAGLGMKKRKENSNVEK